MTKKLLLLIPAVAMMAGCSENDIIYKRLNAIVTQDFEEINKIDEDLKNSGGVRSTGGNYDEPIGGPETWARDSWS